MAAFMCFYSTVHTLLGINSRGYRAPLYRVCRDTATLALHFQRGEIIEFDKGPYAQTLGLVHLLARFHPGKAKKLKQLPIV